MIKSTNRKWQNHLKAKGVISFFLDRLQSHAFSTQLQYDKSPFNFPIENRELEDELAKAFFHSTEFFPYEINLELTNNCNLNCKMCVRPEMTREKGFMDDELYKKIIDEIASKNPYAFISFYGIGESTLDKSLVEKLEYARELNLVNTTLTTNGQLMLHNDLYKKLADSGISTIRIDFDGFSQQAYGAIRIGGDYNTVKEAVIKLYDYKRKNNLNCRIELAFHIYPEINEHETEMFVNWCEKNDYEYVLVTMHTWGGLRKDIPPTKFSGLPYLHQTTNKRKAPCVLLWNGFVITWNGDVAVCFQDANVEKPCGNINKMSIEEAWRGPHFSKRKEHVSGTFTGICAECDSFTESRLPPFGSRLYPKSLLKK